MATFVLIHGAGDTPATWGFVTPLLQAAGDRTIAVTLPCDDDSAQLSDYIRTTVDQVRAAEPDGDLIVVAQSIAGFVGPPAAVELGAQLLVMLCAMIPKPGESAGEWWGNTGSGAARAEKDLAEGRDPDEFDPIVTFLHDLEPEALSYAMSHPPREQSETIFEQPFPLAAWPDISTEVLIGADDRFFPESFMRRVSVERLGIAPDVIDSGHVPSLAAPKALAAQLLAYKAAHGLS